MHFLKGKKRQVSKLPPQIQGQERQHGRNLREGGKSERKCRSSVAFSSPGKHAEPLIYSQVDYKAFDLKKVSKSGEGQQVEIMNTGHGIPLIPKPQIGADVESFVCEIKLIEKIEAVTCMELRGKAYLVTGACHDFRVYGLTWGQEISGGDR